MAETEKDGGEAFPRAYRYIEYDKQTGKEVERAVMEGAPGMFLLDWFAGQALVGLGNADVSYEVAAKTCYDQADAMVAEHNRRLAARRQEQPDDSH